MVCCVSIKYSSAFPHPQFPLPTDAPSDSAPMDESYLLMTVRTEVENQLQRAQTELGYQFQVEIASLQQVNDELTQNETSLQKMLGAMKEEKVRVFYSACSHPRSHACILGVSSADSSNSLFRQCEKSLIKTIGESNSSSLVTNQ